MTAWIRSSLCVSGDCLEAMKTSLDGRVVLVQDSKAPSQSGGPLQAWEPWEWDELLVAVINHDPHPGIEAVGVLGHVKLGLPYRDHEPLVFTAAEWSAFVAGVLAGEFDFDNLSTPDPAPPHEGGTGADEVTAATDSAVTATVGEGVSGEAPSSTVLDAPAGRSSLAPWGGAETGQPGPDYELPRQICWARHDGLLCDRRRDHDGAHVDIYGPLPGHIWPQGVGECVPKWGSGPLTVHVPESHLSSATGDVVAATGAAVAVTGGEAGPVTRTPGPAEPADDGAER